MSGHARFMLSKKCLALALTIDDSLSHTVTHFLTQKADINPLQTLFALTHTQTERHSTDALHEGNRHSTAWEPVSHHVAFRVFLRLIRHSCCWPGFVFITWSS